MEENMNKSRSGILTALISALIAAAVAAVIGYSVGAQKGQSDTSAMAINQRPQVIAFEDYQKLVEENSDFFLLIARPSCKFCAIVDDYILTELPSPEKPVYYLSLESLRHGDRYDEVKAVLDIDFVPTFQYYEKGHLKYNLNNPLDDDYFTADTNEDLVRVHHNMVEKINAFVDGAMGRGIVISEPVKRQSENMDVIQAQPIS